MEYSPHGDLWSKCFEKSKMVPRRNFKEKVLRKIFIQCCEALQYLHQLGLVHRNIKPQNILLYKNQYFEDFIKLSDLKIKNTYQSHYQAPEITVEKNSQINQNQNQEITDEKLKKQQDYNPNADIWSLGVTFHSVSRQIQPNRQEYYKASKGSQNEFPLMPPKYSQHWQSIIKSCIKFNPTERATLEELISKCKQNF